MLLKPLLKEILQTPTAPYRERMVIDKLAHFLKAKGVPHYEDPSGNVVVGAESEAQHREKVAKASEPVRFFVAHTDHPGFHGLSWTKKNELKAKWFGGSPTEKLVGAKVWVGSKSERVFEGRVQSVKLHRSKLHLESLTIAGLPKESWNEPAVNLFGGFSFRKPMWQEGQILRTQAADDLVGCVVIASLAAKLWEKGRHTEKFLAVLTRAEEVGFIGCLAHVEQGVLQGFENNLIAVSLETSRTLPGAIVGKGPVVRLGDRASVFDARALQALDAEAARVLGKKYQRRLMDGGTCEGTVFAARGITTVGISVPLGNYHNQSFEGGPDSRGKLGPAPEFVHLKDIEGMYQLCEAYVESHLDLSHVFQVRLDTFKQRLQNASTLLEARW